MAMLAEPRRKQKVINLRAKNNAWSDDNTKFGQRMLEKMGWKSGKGLGANENGITEHVVARYKNDEKGLGFEDKNDQWTKHEDDFNALLANLSNASDNTENLHSGVSLEVKSKKSKARIHYHKFTRGKDISRYSEKDLANIFGKKTFKDTQQVAEPVKEDLKTTEQIFTEKGSMEDYFKNKLAAFKSKNKNVSNVDDNDYDEPGYAFQGFAQNADDEIAHESETTNGFGYNSQNKESNENCVDNLESESVKVKKKKKKSKKSDNGEPSENNCNNDPENDTQNEPQTSDQNEECTNKIKKKKKSKDKLNVDVSEEVTNGCDDLEHNIADIDQIIKKNKKSKKKHVDTDLTENSCIEEDLKKLSKKKKKSKIKEQNDDIVYNGCQEENVELKNSKRKYKLGNEDATESMTEVPKKKNKKRKKEL
ncbi:uncharacterized protein [Epargyreus clarus]|uniref:uncharacterized protein n=1 Tax=Epargyreus clarus TaxID=520877 RepID=UPI003C309809